MDRVGRGEHQRPVYNTYLMKQIIPNYKRIIIKNIAIKCETIAVGIYLKHVSQSPLCTLRPQKHTYTSTNHRHTVEARPQNY